MYSLFETLIENAEDNDFSLKSIDPREKATDAKGDDMLYREAYTKASIAINELYKKNKEILSEVIQMVRELHVKIVTTKMEYPLIRTNLYPFILNPSVSTSILLFVQKNTEKAIETLNISLNSSERNEDSVDIAMDTFKQHIKEFEISSFLGEKIKINLNSKIIPSSVNKLNMNMINLNDELYYSYVLLSNMIVDKKHPAELELCARMFEYACKVANAIAAVYVYAAMELDRYFKIVVSGNKPINETATNEENTKQYIAELDKLIDEIRDFYDKFEYKEVLTPRKKKEEKMYEYMLGALQRKYTLKIPMYKVEGSSKDVKDIVENKFINKLESITKKYPNFCIMSPSWDEDDDMFIYVTLREPFGDKEDRSNREDQAKVIQEASLTAKERKALDDCEYGLPDKRKYPLNDEIRIKQAIKFFGYCEAADKATLATNIVKRILLLDLFGKVYVSENHPNKKSFPEWLIGNKAEQGYTVTKDGDKYTIKDADGNKVDWYTIKNLKPMNESVIFDKNGKLF